MIKISRCLIPAPYQPPAIPYTTLTGMKLKCFYNFEHSNLVYFVFVLGVGGFLFLHNKHRQRETFLAGKNTVHAHLKQSTTTTAAKLF